MSERFHVEREQRTGRSVEEIIDLSAERVPLQLTQAERALDLLDALW